MKYLIVLMLFALPAQAQEARYIENQYFYVIEMQHSDLVLGKETDYGKPAYRNAVWAASARLSDICGLRVDVWTTNLMTDDSEIWPPNQMFAFLAMANSEAAALQAVNGIPCARGGFVKRGNITIPASFRHCAGPDDGSEKYAKICY